MRWLHILLAVCFTVGILPISKFKLCNDTVPICMDHLSQSTMTQMINSLRRLEKARKHYDVLYFESPFQGDSGGPLVRRVRRKWWLIGVSSLTSIALTNDRFVARGDGGGIIRVADGTCYGPTIFTNIMFFKKEIEDYEKKLEKD